MWFLKETDENTKKTPLVIILLSEKIDFEAKKNY